jgi:hypothetical protein
MPVRAKAEDRISLLLLGGVWFLHGVPQNVPEEDYEAVKALSREIYARANAHDWNRVLLEATSIHLSRQRLDESHKDSGLNENVCGDCLRDAVLMYDRIYGEGEPKNAPRHLGDPRGFSVPKYLRTAVGRYARHRVRHLAHPDEESFT